MPEEAYVGASAFPPIEPLLGDILEKSVDLPALNPTVKLGKSAGFAAIKRESLTSGLAI